MSIFWPTPPFAKPLTSEEIKQSTHNFHDMIRRGAVVEDKSGHGNHGTLHGFTEHDKALSPDEVREVHDESR